MKKSISLIIMSTFTLTTSLAHAEDAFTQHQQETNKIWSPSEDGSKDDSQDSKIATSMVAWGIGLAVVIGLVFGLVKSYQSSSTTK
jgi:hypothetical protein